MPRLLGLVSIAACVGIIGCGPGGPELGHVTGQIKLDGEIMQRAYVTFLPLSPNGMELTGVTDADGRYEIKYSAERDGVPLGKYQVLLSTMDDIKNPDGSNTKVPEKFPPVYVNGDSPLEFEVVAGENDASFDIDSKAK